MSMHPKNLRLELAQIERMMLAALTLMSAEGSRYNRGGFIELGEYPRWFSGEMNADPLTIER